MKSARAMSDMSAVSCQRTRHGDDDERPRKVDDEIKFSLKRSSVARDDLLHFIYSVATTVAVGQIGLSGLYAVHGCSNNRK